MIYRVKQFFWAITAKLTPEEQDFIKQYLSEEEEKLFNQLKVYEQKHCINVAKALQNEVQDMNQENMIRAGLLHDIGKIKYPIGPIRKSMMVLLDKFTKGKIAKYTRLGMVRCYYEHPQLGYELLKQKSGYQDEFLRFIQQHHQEINEVEYEDKALDLLKKWDSQY